MSRPAGSIVSLLLAVLTVNLVACDSGDDSGGDLDAATYSAIGQTVSTVFTVIPLAIAEVQFAKEQPASKGPNGTCSQGGSFEVDGTSSFTVNSYTLDVDIDFLDCNGLDGSLGISGSGSFSETSVTSDITMDGSVSGQCSLTFNSFRSSTETNVSAQSTIATLDGQYSGSCSGDGFTCSFDDTEVSATAAGSSSTLQQHCSAN